MYWTLFSYLVFPRDLPLRLWLSSLCGNMLLWFFLFLLFLLFDLGVCSLSWFHFSFLVFQIAFSLSEQVYILSQRGLLCMVAEILIVFFLPCGFVEDCLVVLSYVLCIPRFSRTFFFLLQMGVGFFQRPFLCPVRYILWWSTHIIIKSICYCILWHICHCFCYSFHPWRIQVWIIYFTFFCVCLWNI